MPYFYVDTLFCRDFVQKLSMALLSNTESPLSHIDLSNNNIEDRGNSCKIFTFVLVNEFIYLKFQYISEFYLNIHSLSPKYDFNSIHS